MKQNDKRLLKMALRERLLSLEASELSTAQDHYASFLSDSKMTEGEPHDTSEIAEARENADLAAAFDHPVKEHHAKIDALENLDFELTDHVAPGAVVAFAGRHVVISVATAKFEHDGVNYMGISPDSPIYKEMEGLSAGNSLVFNGKEIHSDDVF